MTAKHAAAYLRRSSVSGDNPGDASREAQEAAVRRLCGDDVVLYVDWGISGRKTDRPEYVKLKRAIAAGEVASVCAYSLSRLGRNARELLDFIELAQKHDVPVRTSVESIDTSTAMGRAMLTVMAAFAQLEVEQGMERSAAARAARQSRHDEAGVPMPASVPIYGRKHVTLDGITHIVPDEDRPIGPVIEAYRQAGSIRGACEVLQREGVPAPRGGKVWGASTLTRILEAHIPDELPEGIMNAKAGRRPVRNTAAPFAGLLRCHCGRTMTPNVARGQYYCAAGRDSGSELHGKMSVTEKALRAVLESEAARYNPRLVLTYRDGSTAERERLERRMANLDVKLDAGRLTGEQYKRQMAELQAEVAKLAHQARVVDKLSIEPVPSWDDVPGMNRHLRRLWTSVRLDRDMRPLIEWAIPAWQYDEAAIEAREAEIASAERGPEDEWRASQS